MKTCLCVSSYGSFKRRICPISSCLLSSRLNLIDSVHRMYSVNSTRYSLQQLHVDINASEVYRHYIHGRGWCFISSSQWTEAQVYYNLSQIQSCSAHLETTIVDLKTRNSEARGAAQTVTLTLSTLIKLLLLYHNMSPNVSRKYNCSLEVRFSLPDGN